MLTFKQYLLEKREKEDVPLDEKEILRLFSGDFSDSLALISHHRGVLFRGESAAKTGIKIIKQATTDRTPKEDGEHYNPLLDTNPANAAWPKRARSTFVTNDEHHAKLFGKVYYAFPENNTKVAVLPEHDMWDMQVELYHGASKSMHRLSSEFRYLGLDPKGLTTHNLKDRISQLQDPIVNMLNNMLDPERVFSYDTLKVELISDMRKLADIATKGSYHEMWFEGRCLLIEPSILHAAAPILKREGLI